MGRLVAQKLGEVLPGTVVVENRPGAGGHIGTVAAARAPKDGHTLLMTISSAQAINPAVYKKPGFDPVKDFTPPAQFAALLQEDIARWAPIVKEPGAMID